MAIALGDISKLAMIPKWVFGSAAAWIVMISMAARERPLELAERVGGDINHVGPLAERAQAVLAHRDLMWPILTAACLLGIVAFYGLLARYDETKSVEDAAIDIRCSTALWIAALVALTGGGFWTLAAFFGGPVLAGMVIWRFSRDAGWVGLVPVSFMYAILQPILKLLTFFGLVKT